MKRSLNSVVGLLTLAIGVAAFAVAAPAWAVDPPSIDGREDFGQISRLGFEEVVDGQFVAGDGTYPNLVPNVPPGSQANSYPWSNKWWNGQLWVGTVRNLLCFLSPGQLPEEECPPVPEGGGLPTPRYPEEAAQIWRYTPAGPGGLDGEWEMVYQSPQRLLLGIPADIGFRTAEVCDAGGLETIYFTNLGIPGRIIYWDDGQQDFVEASNAGDTFVGVVDLLNQTVDLGYRGLACMDFPNPAYPGSGEPEYLRKLCTAPAASFTDTDTTLHPWVICNEDPAGQDPAISDNWVAHSPLGIVAPFDDIGIFDMETVENDGDPEQDFLCLGGFDRTNGASIYCTDGTGCPTCVWEEIVEDGMGRPDSALGDFTGGAISNAAGFGMGTFDDDGDGKAEYLYFGMADAAGGPAANNYQAEMGRIIFDEDAPAEDFMKWELIAGIPRITDDYGFACATGFGFTPKFVIPAKMKCELEGLPPYTSAPCICMPQGGRGLGFSTDPLDVGASSYFWRFTQHEGDLFMGDLDLFDGGFNLYKTSDGLNWTEVDDFGLGWGITNYGVRGLESNDPTPGTKDAGSGTILALGAANPFSDEEEGGMQVWLGTVEPELPPEAVLWWDQMRWDSELCSGPDSCPPGDGLVSFNALDGTESFDPFGGEIATWEWYPGNETGNCDTPVTTPIPGAVSDTYDPGPLAAGFPFSTYEFTLRVTDDNPGGGAHDCDLVSKTAAGNQRPFAIIETTPRRTGGSLTLPQTSSGTVRLVDFDNDGKETFEITGRCTDPEGALVSCDWTSIDGGLTFIPAPSHPGFGTYVGTVEALIEEDAEDLFGDSSPDIRLTATDDQSFTWTTRIDVRVESFIDTPEANDQPDCEAGIFYTQKGTPITLTPFDDGGDSHLCGDADGDVLSVQFRNPAPAFGSRSTDGTEITYTPNPGVTGIDTVYFRACDDAGACASGGNRSNTVPIEIHILECAPEDVDVVLDGETYAGTDSELACETLTSINATTVQTGGDVDFTAGRMVVLEDGFSVESGSIFTINLQPALAGSGLSIEKEADKTLVTAASEVITYTYTLENSGTENLTGVSVVDLMTVGTGTDPTPTYDSGDNDSDSTLDLTETWTYEGTYTVTAADCAAAVDIENTATADSDQTGSVTDSVSVATAGIGLAKTVTDVDGGGPTGEVDEAGDVVTYQYEVTATGCASLTGVTVTDVVTTNDGVNPVPEPVDDSPVDTYNDGDTNTDGKLDPGEIWLYTATYEVTADDFANQTSIDNTATADSAETDPVTSDSSVPVVLSPG